MIGTDIVLSLNAAFKGQNLNALRPAILTVEYDDWPLGTPVIIIKGHERHERMDHGIVASSLMSPSNAIGGYKSVLTPSRGTVRPFGKEDLIIQHRTYRPDYIDPSKIDHLLEYVKDVGSISFLIESQVGINSMVDDIIKYILGRFKYHNINYFRYWIQDKYLIGDDDKRLGLINIFDLPYCIPIFNHRKADGVGVSIKLITKKRSLKYKIPHKLMQLDVVCNNYKDNMLTLDGDQLVDFWPIDFEITHTINHVINTKIKRVSEKTVEKSRDKTYKFDFVEPQKLEEISYEKPIKEYNISNTNFFYTTTASTSTS